jgi:poly-gamma-glutamate capsule biosynthesis protein CapA/YwtB (metallophosphatase superfamily)
VSLRVRGTGPPGRRRLVALAAAAVVTVAGVVTLVHELRPDGGPANWMPPAAAPTASGAAERSPAVTGGAGQRQLSLVAAGDILVHPAVTEQARGDARRAGRAGYDFFPMFQHVGPVISKADLALCHLEIPLGEPSGPFAGYPRFNAPPQLLDGIRRAGFDGCSLASNHTLDQGERGVVRTIEAFEAAGLGHTGSARTPVEATRPEIYERSGIKVGHLSYTLHFNGLRRPAGKDWLANLIEPTKILAAAARARAAGAAIVVLSLHWGTEYQHTPDASQQQWADQLIGSPDIDLILGHHAHVVQPVQRRGDKWIVFGMGNQLARHADPIEANREGVMARITFTEAGSGRWRISRTEAIPTWTDLSPAIRLVDLPAALREPDTPADRRRVYRAAYDRVGRHVAALGGVRSGLVVVPIGR